jgi:hypothetical protein
MFPRLWAGSSGGRDRHASRQNLGSVRMRKAASRIAKRTEVLSQANDSATRDPDQVLTMMQRDVHRTRPQPASCQVIPMPIDQSP